jgi:hypothetical protein
MPAKTNDTTLIAILAIVVAALFVASLGVGPVFLAPETVLDGLVGQE